MCFVRISEQTAIISLYGLNWSVFITEKECVYCAVRTGSLSIIQVEIRLERIKSGEIMSNTLYTEERIIMIGLDAMGNRRTLSLWGDEPYRIKISGLHINVW